MQSKHILLLAAFLGALAVQMSSLHAWHEVASPMFVSGVLAQIVVLLKTIYTSAPRDPERRSRDSDWE